MSQSWLWALETALYARNAQFETFPSQIRAHGGTAHEIRWQWQEQVIDDPLVYDDCRLMDRLAASWRSFNQMLRPLTEPPEIAELRGRIDAEMNRRLKSGQGATKPNPWGATFTGFEIQKLGNDFEAQRKNEVGLWQNERDANTNAFPEFVRTGLLSLSAGESAQLSKMTAPRMLTLVLQRMLGPRGFSAVRQRNPKHYLEYRRRKFNLVQKAIAVVERAIIGEWPVFLKQLTPQLNLIVKVRCPGLLADGVIDVNACLARHDVTDFDANADVGKFAEFSSGRSGASFYNSYRRFSTTKGLAVCLAVQLEEIASLTELLEEILPEFQA